ncbi:MAG: L-rhamnose/proton symporter RhaT [Bacteroidales bacterium]
MSAAGEKLASAMFSGTGGSYMLGSIILSLVGIGVCGWAASLKEKDLSNQATGSDFNLKKGLLVAIVAGVMSACFSFGESTGKAMAELTVAANPGTIWKFNGVYAVLLIGGFAFNALYCIILAIKNGSWKDYASKESPLLRNYIFGLLAGAIWFTQFVFKGIGTTKIPASLDFIAWTILFSSVIVFSNLIGLLTGEWKGVSLRTRLTLLAGLLFLILSVALVGIASKSAGV